MKLYACALIPLRKNCTFLIVHMKLQIKLKMCQRKLTKILNCFIIGMYSGPRLSNTFSFWEKKCSLTKKVSHNDQRMK